MTQVGVGRQEQCGLAGGPDIRCYAIVSCVSREEERYTPSSSIPYANGGVQSSGGDPHTIKSDAVYLVEMPFEDMDAFTRIHVPYLCTKQHHQHQLDSGKAPSGLGERGGAEREHWGSAPSRPEREHRG